MKDSSTIKKNARHRSKEQVLPALRFSMQDKSKIRKLAKLRGTSASKSVMELVDTALGNAKPESANGRNSTGPKRRLTGKELMALPADVRHRRLEVQAKKAAIFYRTDPDLNFQINDDILESELKRKVAPVRLSAREIRKLPEKERAKILRAAAKMAVEDYKPGGELYIEY
jgi:hypothetical protein